MRERLLIVYVEKNTFEGHMRTRYSVATVNVFRSGLW